MYPNVPIKLVMLNESLMLVFYSIIYNLFVIDGYKGILNLVDGFVAHYKRGLNFAM